MEKASERSSGYIDAVTDSSWVGHGNAQACQVPVG